MMTKINQQIEELMKEYEENKHRYSSLEHFCNLCRYNLDNNTNFTPEEMSNDFILRTNKILGKVYNLFPKG